MILFSTASTCYTALAEPSTPERTTPLAVVAVYLERIYPSLVRSFLYYPIDLYLLLTYNA